MSLADRIKRLVQSQRLLRRGGRVVVAVSGGVDSMVLLHAVHGLAQPFGWKVSVAHFNHHLRGRSSDADERLVRKQARLLELNCDVGHGNVRQHAERKKLSVEMAARALRHAFLVRCAKKRRAKVVMLAQHADDQVELFLMRLMRGAGMKGLGGMRISSPSPADSRVSLVRPLLECSKDELVGYAREHRIRYREDASNRSDEYERNWIRLKLLPTLRERHPNVGANIYRSIRLVQAESDFVREAARSWLKAKRAKTGTRPTSFEKLHLALQRQVIQVQLIDLKTEPEFHLIESLRSHVGKAVSIGSDRELILDRDGTVRERCLQRPHFTKGQCEIHLPCNREEKSAGHVDFGGITLSWRLLSAAGSSRPARRANVEFFDAEQLGARLVLRHWRPGDRFQPIGFSSATKLQDWFTNRKVPAEDRRRLVLAESERGEIVWVEGERIGEPAKITRLTRRMLELRWKRR